MLMPCPTASRCFPCFVSPIENISSENEDLLTFIGYSGSSQEPPLDPPNGTTWDSTGCLTTCESTISQEDADLCAQRQQIYCNTAKWHDPVTGGPPTIFLNNAQSCSKNCPDGLAYTFTVPAGTFAALSQILADRMAFTYACSQASVTKVCLSALSQNGCVGSSYNASISLSNAISPVTWEVTSGALPDGLTLGGFSPNIDVTPGATETIQGTPTVGGTFTFTIRAIDSTQRFMEKQYTICIQSISPSTLPPITIGTAYSQAMTATCAGSITWSASNLPSGLTINPSSGLISGTPTGSQGTFDIVVTATPSTGSPCSKHYPTTTHPSTQFMCVTSDTDWQTIQLVADTPPNFSAGVSKFTFASGPNPNLWSNGISTIQQTVANVCTISIPLQFGTLKYQRTSSDPTGVYTYLSSAPYPAGDFPPTLTLASCSNYPPTLQVDQTTLTSLIPFFSPGGPFFTGLMTYNNDPHNPNWQENLSDGSSLDLRVKNLNPGVDDPSWYWTVTGNHAPNFFTSQRRINPPAQTSNPKGSYIPAGPGWSGQPATTTIS